MYQLQSIQPKPKPKLHCQLRCRNLLSNTNGRAKQPTRYGVTVKLNRAASARTLRKPVTVCLRKKCHFIFTFHPRIVNYYLCRACSALTVVNLLIILFTITCVQCNHCDHNSTVTMLGIAISGSRPGSRIPGSRPGPFSQPWIPGLAML